MDEEHDRYRHPRPRPVEPLPGRFALTRPPQVYFFSPYDGLRPTTNPIADRRFCQGLLAEGAPVELIVPNVFRRTNLPRRLRASSYGPGPEVPTRRMPTPMFERLDRWNLPVLLIAIAVAYLALVVRHRGSMRSVVVVSRDPNCVLPILAVNRLLGSRRSRVVLWAHEYRPERARFRSAYGAVDAMLATNSAILEAWRRDAPAPKPSAVTSNPIPESYLAPEPDRVAARRGLGITGDAPLVVYTGKLGFGLSEVEHLIAAAALLPNCRFVLTGGKRSVVTEFRRRCSERGASNIAFTGLLPRVEDARAYQRAADVLVSYYSSDDHDVRFNLPQKIAEYMASHAVIVTPDFPATRELLSAGNAIFVEPDDPEALAGGISAALTDPERAATLAERAYRDVQEVTVSKRAREVNALLASLTSGAAARPGGRR